MSTKPTSSKVTNLVLQAIRRRFIGRGIHPTRAIHVPSRTRLVIRHTRVNCKTIISHDGLLLSLEHEPGAGLHPVDIKTIPLADPDLVDKVVEWIGDWD